MNSGHGEKHQAILDAAFTLFGTQGFYETKMSQIADQAGIAKGTLYLYFENKEKLFSAVSKRDFDDFLTRLDQGLKRQNNLEEKLLFIAQHHLEYYFERRRYTNLFFMTPNNDPDLMRMMKEFIKNYTEAIIRVLEEGHVPEPNLYANAYIGMLDRLKMDILFDGKVTKKDLAHQAHFVSHLFIHGCTFRKDE